MQMPPAYSAIKVDGKRAYDEARKGHVINLEPRPIEVYSASLLGIFDVEGSVVWKVAFHVSKGTYIRALARDIGKRVGVPAHLRELERESVGSIAMEDCCPLDNLDEVGTDASIDPIALLDMRALFMDREDAARIAHGGFLDAHGRTAYCHTGRSREGGCSCLAPFVATTQPMEDGELFALVADNELVAIYTFCAQEEALKPDCVFQKGVSRGEGI